MKPRNPRNKMPKIFTKTQQHITNQYNLQSPKSKIDIFDKEKVKEKPITEVFEYMETNQVMYQHTPTVRFQFFSFIHSINVHFCNLCVNSFNGFSKCICLVAKFGIISFVSVIFPWISLNLLFTLLFFWHFALSLTPFYICAR